MENHAMPGPSQGLTSPGAYAIFHPKFRVRSEKRLRPAGGRDADYLNALWNVINWEEVGRRFDQARA